MRKRIVSALGPLLAAGIVAAALVLRQDEPAPSVLPAAVPEAAGTPQSADETLPAVLAAVAPEAAETPQPAEDPPPALPAAPSASLSALPVQEVEPRTVHAVPEMGGASIPHVTLLDQQGHPLSRPSTPAPPPPSYVPSVGPAPHYAASSAPSASNRPSIPARGGSAQPAQQAALPPPPSSLSGPAHATGTVSLAIDGHTVRLYGLLPPSSSDRCALGTGAPQACTEVTQTTLAARLAHSASVTCQLPPGVAAADPARICLDASGVDIGGYLVGEGLAMADPRASGGYAGAESGALSAGKGLWRFR
jgi:endonuclease YncB( thermonuclease family)